MQIIIQSPRLKISKRLEKVVRVKFSQFEQVSSRIMRCDVLLKKEKSAEQHGCIVEAKLAVPGKDLFAKEAAEKFEIAVERVCVDLKGQMRRHKVISNR